MDSKLPESKQNNLCAKKMLANKIITSSSMQMDGKKSWGEQVRWYSCHDKINLDGLKLWDDRKFYLIFTFLRKHCSIQPLDASIHWRRWRLATTYSNCAIWPLSSFVEVSSWSSSVVYIAINCHWCVVSTLICHALHKYLQIQLIIAENYDFTIWKVEFFALSTDVWFLQNFGF